MLWHSYIRNQSFDILTKPPHIEFDQRLTVLRGNFVLEG
jgi:hypothetical protein